MSGKYKDADDVLLRKFTAVLQTHPNIGQRGYDLLRDPEKPGRATVVRRFGSFEAAKKLALPDGGTVANVPYSVRSPFFLTVASLWRLSRVLRLSRVANSRITLPATQACLAVHRADINPSQTGPPEQSGPSIAGGPLYCMYDPRSHLVYLYRNCVRLFKIMFCAIQHTSSSS